MITAPVIIKHNWETAYGWGMSATAPNVECHRPLRYWLIVGRVLRLVTSLFFRGIPHTGFALHVICAVFPVVHFAFLFVENQSNITLNRTRVTPCRFLLLN
jgi:hypothetical protein